jgi:hypothetical protein
VAAPALACPAVAPEKRLSTFAKAAVDTRQGRKTQLWLNVPDGSPRKLRHHDEHEDQFGFLRIVPGAKRPWLT